MNTNILDKQQNIRDDNQMVKQFLLILLQK